MSAESTVHVTVTSPPHSSKLPATTPSAVPLITHDAVSPLLYASGAASNDPASTQDKLAGRLGSSNDGSGAGATSILTTSSIELLSQPVGAVYVIVIVPPHSSKSGSTDPAAIPDISHTPVSPLLNVASGAIKLAASAHVTSAIAGTSITGSGDGATSIVTDSTIADLSQLSADGTVHVTVIVPPHWVKLASTTPGIVPLISQDPVSPLLNVASGATKFPASPHVTSVIVGTVRTGSGDGATFIVTTSSTELLSQPVGAVYVIVIVPPHSSKFGSTVPIAIPDISHTPASLLVNGASGAAKFAASAHDTSAIAGKSITGSGDGATSIVTDSTIAGLSQLSSDSIVHVTVIVPPHCVKLESTTAGIVPLIAQTPVSPLLYVASGATKLAASAHDTSAIVGTVITGSGAGITSIVTTSSTELLSQPVGVIYVSIIVPPHSSKLFSTVGVITPDISQTPVSPFVNVASGAVNVSASPQLKLLNAGTSITGSGDGATSIVTDSTISGLSQLSDDGTVHVTVIVPPHCVKLVSTIPGTVPLIPHTPVSPLLKVASGAANTSASPHVTSAITGIVITGSGEGATSIVTTSSTELLSQPVGAI